MRGASAGGGGDAGAGERFGEEAEGAGVVAGDREAVACEEDDFRRGSGVGGGVVAGRAGAEEGVERVGGGGAVGRSDRGDDGVGVAGAVEEREEHADDGGGRKPLAGLADEEDADAVDRAHREIRGDPEAAIVGQIPAI